MVIGFWSIVVLGALVALGWFGWRTLFRIAEKNFWALNSIACGTTLQSHFVRVR